MKTLSLFVRLRSAVAPFLRPMLEHVGPVRKLGLWMLSRRQRATFVQGGHTFEVDPADFGVTFELASTGDYERKTRELCMSHLKPGMTFVDVGAHVGLYTIPAAEAVGPSGRVYAFDPDPDNFQRLSRNVQASGYQNIELHNKAVCDVDGTMTLHRSPYNTGDHQIYYKGKSRHTVEVQSVSLDRFFASRPGQVDVCKFDIQGAEAAAMRGMQQMLGRPGELRMFLEFAPSMLRDSGADPLALLKSLEARGFALSLIDDAEGAVTAASPESIMHNCREHAYVNIMCHRPA